MMCSATVAEGFVMIKAFHYGLENREIVKSNVQIKDKEMCYCRSFYFEI